jgi:hypothetical protein
MSSSAEADSLPHFRLRQHERDIVGEEQAGGVNQYHRRATGSRGGKFVTLKCRQGSEFLARGILVNGCGEAGRSGPFDQSEVSG